MLLISNFVCSLEVLAFEPPHDKTNKMTAPSEDSGEPEHPPSLIRVFAVRSTQAFFVRTVKTVFRLGEYPC